MTDTGTNTTGITGVTAAHGYTPTTGVDPAGVTGPLLVGEVTDATGVVVGAVGVVDDGDTADALLNEVLGVFAAELGGTGRVAGPVAGGSEIAAKFSAPTVVSGWSDTADTVRVVTIETNDRRNQGGATSQASPTAAAFSSTVPGAGGGGLDRLVNVSLEVSVEIGRTRVTLADVLAFDVGSTIELDRAAGAPVDIRVNDTLLAQGEV
ncbi:MAG: FliM/FliN family flagellar motor switch protein, partial [Acidimicrobiales bacterium]